MIGLLQKQDMKRGAKASICVHIVEQNALHSSPGPGSSVKFYCVPLEPCWKQEHLKLLTVLTRQIHTFVQLRQHPVPHRTQSLQG